MLAFAGHAKKWHIAPFLAHWEGDCGSGLQGRCKLAETNERLNQHLAPLAPPLNYLAVQGAWS